MPVTVILDGKVYRDGIDISVVDFYRQFENYSHMESKPISYEDYALEYMKLTRQYDEILCIHVSRHLSATYDNAMEVHRDLGDGHSCRVEIIDSGQCSLGLGMAVMAAADASAQGLRITQIRRIMNSMWSRMSSYMAIPTLKYLKRGKKISGIKAMLGLALGMKPVLTIKDGRMVVRTKFLGKQKNMVLSMMDIIKEDIANQPISVAIAHTRDLKIVDNLKAVFDSNFTCRSIYTSYFGPSIGLNTGPETVSVFLIKEEG